MNHPPRIATPRFPFKPFALVTLLGLACLPAQAQTVLPVGGSGTIADETLPTVAEGSKLVAQVPRGGVHWTANGGEGVVYSKLNSPTLTVPHSGEVTLKFTHRFDFEDGYDGGVVYLSVNGAAPTQVAAGAFTANGYNANLSGSSAFTNQDVFNGTSEGYDTLTLIQSVASLGTLAAGDKISIQFRGGWDEGYAAPAPDWEIGTVELRDSLDTAILDVDFLNGAGKFTAVSDVGLAGPWRYAGPQCHFEIDADALTADRYVPDSPGPNTIIDLSGADIAVVLLGGTLDIGDAFNLFDLAGGTTLRGSYNSISLPPGQWNLSNLGVTGTIVYVGPPITDADVSTVAASLPKIWADGFDTSTVTVSLKSVGGDPVAGKTVSLVSSRSGGVDIITPATALSDASGVATFRVKSSTVGGPAVFTATDVDDGPVVLTQTVSVSYAANPPALASYIPADNAGYSVSVLKDFDFHGSTYAGWSHSRNSILTDAGVQMGAVIPGISDHGAWVALLSHPVAGDADIGGLSYLNSGVEIRFNAPNMTPPTDSLELLTLKCIHPSEDGFGISATYGTQKMYTRQKNGGSHIWANSDKAQLIGCHTLTLLRLDGGTIKTYLDGVAVDTWTGTPEPVGVLDHIGLGLNEFDGNQYWPIGAVVSRVTAFTVAAGASTAPFASWITGFYPTAGDPKAAPNADPDGDGLKNSVEYVLGTPPNAANPGGPSGSTSGSNFVFTFQRALASKHADTAVAIEVSTDLATWTAYDVNASPVVVTPGLDADHETVTLSLPRAPDAKKFARLQVSVSAAP